MEKMRKSILANIIVLAFLCSACGGGINGKAVGVRLADGLDPSVETVDSECAYFYFMWGRTAELEGKLEEAREAYEKALVCDLHAVHVMRRLAILLVNMDKKREAANWTQRIIDENPDDDTSQAFLANLYVSMNENEKAEDIYKKIISENPDDFDNVLMLGTLYARQKKYDQARETLEDLVDRNPESFIGYHYLAKVYFKMDKVDQARKAFEKALELNWSPLLAFEAGAFLEKNAFIEDAVKIYRQILVEDEGNEMVRTRIIALLLQEDKVEEAISELERLLPFATDVPRVELNIGRLLFERKLYDEAIEHLKEALEVDPEFNDARTLMALIQHEKGDDQGAIDSLQEIGAESDDYEDATLLLVRLFVGKKKYEVAEKLLRKRIEKEETRRLEFYPALASVMQMRGMSEEAEEVFQEGLDVYDHAPEILLEYAIFQDETGDTDAALATMAEVLEKKPEDPFALNYIGYTLADRGENLEKSLEYIRKAISLKPDDGYVRDSLGWVLFKMGRTEEAAREMEKALEIEPEDPTINEHAGDIYLKQGKVKQAVAAWEKALQFYSDENKKSPVRQKIEAAGK